MIPEISAHLTLIYVLDFFKNLSIITRSPENRIVQINIEVESIEH